MLNPQSSPHTNAVALRKGYTILVYFPAFRGLGRGMTSRPPINVDMISVLFCRWLATLYVIPGTTDDIMRDEICLHEFVLTWAVLGC